MMLRPGFVAVCLLSPVAFGQSSVERPLTPSEIRSGALQLWAPTRYTMGYELPEPVGAIELSFSLTSGTIYDTPGRYWILSAASVSFGEYGIVDLPGQLLSCLTSPRPREAAITTLYIEGQAEPDAESGWFAAFTTYVTIPFGPLRPVVIGDDVDILQPGKVEFVITGDQVERIAFIRASGERRGYDYDSGMDGCPVEFVDWMVE